MKFLEINHNEVPMPLLLEADPSESSIGSYLSGSWCFVALENNQIIAACVVNKNINLGSEIFNISVYPEHQKKGIGSKLLKFVLAELKGKGVSRVELGTGTFGHQLSYYQRLGFRVSSVDKDYFLVNYPEAIVENGIQHKDRLRLYIEL